MAKLSIFIWPYTYSVCRALRLAQGAYYAGRHRVPCPERIRESPGKIGPLRGRIAPGYSLTTRGQKIPDGQISEGIVLILEEESSAYSYEKLTWRLRRRFDLHINKKKVYRLSVGRWSCCGLERRLPRNGVITRPNQLRQTDLK